MPPRLNASGELAPQSTIRLALRPFPEDSNCGNALRNRKRRCIRRPSVSSRLTLCGMDRRDFSYQRLKCLPLPGRKPGWFHEVRGNHCRDVGNRKTARPQEMAFLSEPRRKLRYFGDTRACWLPPMPESVDFKLCHRRVRMPEALGDRKEEIEFGASVPHFNT